MRRCAAGAGLLTLCVVLGCGDTGQQRNRVSGTAKFDGKPIAYGEVLFTPDGSKKNSGAQGIATIRDGKFDTSAAGGKGFGGGPAIVRVTGLTAEGGKLLCEYEYPADLPQGEGTLEIDVPAKAAAGAKPKGPDI